LVDADLRAQIRRDADPGRAAARRFCDLARLQRRVVDEYKYQHGTIEQHLDIDVVFDQPRRLRLNRQLGRLAFIVELMQRIACDERSDWREAAEAVGFHFHTIDGERYWDERAYYGFTLEEIERDLEAPTAELEGMCHELATRAIADERMMQLLRIPPAYWNWVATSFKRGDLSLYGRFDFCYDGKGPAKLLEYNADTPTAVFETGVFQWKWLEDAKQRRIVPKDADQYNSLHERLIEGWKVIGQGKDGARHLHLAGMTDSTEDAGTLAYLQDCAHQAGLETSVIAMSEIGRSPRHGFVDAASRPIELMFKLYPWEWMMREAFGASLPGAPTQWVEPPWKAILSNKAILPLLWAMFPRHPNLLPAFFEDDPKAAELGNSYTRKPLYSREGANVELIVSGTAVDKDPGPYGAEGFVRQAIAPLPQWNGNYAVLGSWFAAGHPCGLSMREDLSPITKNTSRFLPHAIVG
jgi:glutathionylspermidine synthase